MAPKLTLMSSSTPSGSKLAKVVQESKGQFVYNIDGWTYVRKFHQDKLPMICVNCKKDVTGVYVSPDTGARYCFDCWKEVRRAKNEIGTVVEMPSAHVDVGGGQTRPLVEVIDGGFDGHRYPSAPIAAHSPAIVQAVELAKQAINSKKEMEIVKGGVNKCCACKQLSNCGQRIGNDWVCSGCLEDQEENAAGFHMRLQPKGNKKNISFFHYVMHVLDSDWPYPDDLKKPIEDRCVVCGGAVYKQPIFDDPKTIKDIATLCGVGKIKIKYWGSANKCEAKG